MKRIVLLVLLVMPALLADAIAQQTRFPLMVNMWGYSQGASGTPAGVANWLDSQGSLTVSGAKGANTLTINSVDIGVISDYALDTVNYPSGWAIVVKGDDAVYRVYTVYAVNTSAGTLSIFPALATSVSFTSGG